MYLEYRAKWNQISVILVQRKLRKKPSHKSLNTRYLKKYTGWVKIEARAASRHCTVEVNYQRHIMCRKNNMSVVIAPILIVYQMKAQSMRCMKYNYTVYTSRYIQYTINTAKQLPEIITRTL